MPLYCQHRLALKAETLHSVNLKNRSAKLHMEVGSMNPKTVDIGGALSTGWARFQKYPGLAIGGMLIYAVMAAVVSWIPFVNFVTIPLVMPPIVGGLYIFFLKMTKDENPEIGDLFAGFSDYVRWLGVYWLFALIMLLCFIPAFICIGIVMIMTKGAQSAAMNGELGAVSGGLGAGAAILMMVGYAISLIIYLIVIPRYGLCFFCAAEGAGAVGSIKQSAEITEGVRPMVLLAFIVFGIIGAIGVVACGVGVLVTAPVSIIALASVYLGLKGEKPQSASTYTYTPPEVPKPEETTQPTTEETPPPSETE